MKPFFIGLSGISGAGKSTLADHLEAQGGVKRFRFDAYYKTTADCPKLPDGRPHWDLPESLYLEEMHEALSDLRNGHDILLPVYNRAVNDRVGTVLYQPAPVIFVEGLQLFSHEPTRNMFDLRLWLEVPEDVALARRLQRQPDYDTEYHWSVAAPAHREHVLPLKQHAHEIINGLQSDQKMTSDADRMIYKQLGILA